MFSLLAIGQTPPDPCVPQLLSDFVGRSEECDAVITSIMPQATRLFSIWGSPGFGKTTTAIDIGNQLKHQGEYVYYFSFRGVSTTRGSLINHHKRIPRISLVTCAGIRLLKDKTSGRAVFSKFSSQIVTTTNNTRFTKPNIKNVWKCSTSYTTAL